MSDLALKSTASRDVSVVTPCYNAAKYIVETLQSVLAQTVAPREIILVNDGSPDTEELERVLAPFRDRIIYIRQENQGASGARNTGIRASTQPLVAFIDSDDLWEPNYIEVQTRYLDEHPDVSVVFPNGRRFGAGPALELITLDANENGPVTFERMIRLEIVVNTSLMARREVLFDAGLYDRGFPTCEDFDLWLRIVKKGHKIGYHHTILMHSRVRPGSLSSQQMRMYTDFLRVLDKCSEMMDLTDRERAAISDQKRDYRARMSLHQGKNAFFSGNTDAAIEHLAQANTYFNSKKLSAAIVALKVAPGLVLKMYHLRDRLVFRTDTKSQYVSS